MRDDEIEGAEFRFQFQDVLPAKGDIGQADSRGGLFGQRDLTRRVVDAQECGLRRPLGQRNQVLAAGATQLQNARDRRIPPVACRATGRRPPANPAVTAARAGQGTALRRSGGPS